MEATIETETIQINDDITLSKEDFKTFTNSLDIIARINQDCEIKNSLIRQKSSDTALFYSFDFTELFSHNKLNMFFTSVKDKMKLIKVFGDEDNNITIGRKDFDGNEEYIVSDNKSYLRLKLPSEKHIQEKFIEEIPTDVFGVVDSNRLFQMDLTKYMSKIKTFIESFGSRSIVLEIKDGEAKFSVMSSSKEINANIMSKSGIDPSINLKTEFNPSGLLVDYDKDQTITMTLGLRETKGGDVIVYKFDNTIDGKVPFTVYQQSKTL